MSKINPAPNRDAVLVVDDDPDLRVILAHAVGKLDCETIVAENGTDALRLLEQSPAEIQAIVSDLNMPRMDGLTLLRHVRIARPTIPVVILTGYWTKESTLAALRLGAFDFLEKPYTPEVFDAAVSAAVACGRANHRAARTLARHLEKSGCSLSEQDAGFTALMTFIGRHVA